MWILFMEKKKQNQMLKAKEYRRNHITSTIFPFEFVKHIYLYREGKSGELYSSIFLSVSGWKRSRRNNEMWVVDEKMFTKAIN